MADDAAADAALDLRTRPRGWRVTATGLAVVAAISTVLVIGLSSPALYMGTRAPGSTPPPYPSADVVWCIVAIAIELGALALLLRRRGLGGHVGGRCALFAIALLASAPAAISLFEHVMNVVGLAFWHLFAAAYLGLASAVVYLGQRTQPMLEEIE